MKVFFHFVFRNVIRRPLRSFLCFFIALLTALVMIVCQTISQRVESALTDLEKNYPAVATITRRAVISPDGVKIPSSRYLTVDEAYPLSQSGSVKAWNITLPAGSLAQEELMGKLPDEEFLAEPPREVISVDDRVSVQAVNNLVLTEAFYSGESKIVEGRLFTSEEMRGGTRAIILSRNTARRYGLALGDKVTFDFENSGSFSLYRVVGIYESGKGTELCYIPLEDYFRDLCMLWPTGAHLDSVAARPDRVIRLDFLLTSPESGEVFIRDAQSLGFDLSAFDININDGAYFAVKDGLEGILLLSRIVFFSVLTVGTVILALIIWFFSSSGKNERTVLRVLGMKSAKISAMFASEYVLIMIAALSAALLSGGAVSDSALHFVERCALEEAVEEANAQEDLSERTNREIILKRKIHLSLIDGYEGLVGEVHAVSNHLEEGKIGVRREIFWSQSGAMTLLGMTDFAVDGFENTASFERDILSESGKLSGYYFRCYVPENSPYRVGEIIPLMPQKMGEALVFTGDLANGLYRGVLISSGLVVSGIYPPEAHIGEEFVLPMKELELMCEYLSISSEKYRSVRYD
ncbi:MAG: ABC transporter permease [Clostridia bacterium]|nr:ABC transporter permease [Clostridia bacterium]